MVSQFKKLMKHSMNILIFIVKEKMVLFLLFSKLNSGRYLKFVFRKILPNKYFIITAYDIENNEIIQRLDQEFE